MKLKSKLGNIILQYNMENPIVLLEKITKISSKDQVEDIDLSHSEERLFFFHEKGRFRHFTTRRPKQEQALALRLNSRAYAN